MRDPINFCVRCGQQMEERHRHGRLRPVCSQCGYIHFVDPKVAVAVVVEVNGQLLLIQRARAPERGKWSFPAGFVDGGEAPARAAEREGLEETGLTLRATRVLDIVPRAADEEGADFLILYQAEVTGGALQPGDDAAAVGFFGPHEFPDLAFPSTRSVVADWQRRLTAR